MARVSFLRVSCDDRRGFRVLGIQCGALEVGAQHWLPGVRPLDIWSFGRLGTFSSVLEQAAPSMWASATHGRVRACICLGGWLQSGAMAGDGRLPLLQNSHICVQRRMRCRKRPRPMADRDSDAPPGERSVATPRCPWRSGLPKVSSPGAVRASSFRLHGALVVLWRVRHAPASRQTRAATTPLHMRTTRESSLDPPDSSRLTLAWACSAAYYISALSISTTQYVVEMLRKVSG